jgi:hypothetical protein
MFKFFKKKQSDPLDKLDKDRWLKDVLLELNLLDVNNLVDMANITKNTEVNKKVKELLTIIQPSLLTAVKLGNTCVTIDITKEQYSEFRDVYLAKDTLKKYGITLKVDCYSLHENSSCYAFISISKPEGKK